MKTMKQLLRQPLKALFGMILMILATAMLCICVGQAIAARTTMEDLENSFTTIGLQEGIAWYNDGLASNEFIAWLDTLAQEHPEIVKGKINNGVLSAYIPELTPLNFTKGISYSKTYIENIMRKYGAVVGPEAMPYTCAALTFTLEEMGEPQENSKTHYLNQQLWYEDFPDNPGDYYTYLETLETQTIHSGYTVKLAGTITGVVSLQEGFRDPTGMTLRITLKVMTLEELEALELVLGNEYLAFGLDYTDSDWIFRSKLASREEEPREFEWFDPAKIRVLEGKELELWERNSPPGQAPYAIYEGWLRFTREEYEQVNSVAMTMGSTRNPHYFEKDEDGSILSITKINEWTVTKWNGEEEKIPLEEYNERYRLPMLAKLDTTAEAFLASEEGTFWRDTLEWAEINHQAFVVIGAEKLGYIADFAKGNSRVTQGRDFTEEEIAEGARVCIIHETLAAANGLKLGDTITLNMYEMDQGFPYFQRMLYTSNIPAYYYYPTEEFVDKAEYTIVGFWRGRQLWIYDHEIQTAFQPNTVIVPESSVQAEMTEIPALSFNALVLHNGMVEEYKMLASNVTPVVEDPDQYHPDVGYEEVLIFYDQGYSEISKSFHNYDELGERVLMVGAAVYAVLLLLFLLLFPASRRKTVQTMETLGVPFGGRFASVITYAAALLIPASLIGGLIGAASWQSVISTLTESAESTITMELQPMVVAGIALAQCVVALLLSTLIALHAARSAGMSRKG